MGKMIKEARNRNRRELVRDIGGDLICIAVSIGLVALPLVLQRFSGS